MNGRQNWHDNLMTQTENYAMMSENILMFLRPPSLAYSLMISKHDYVKGREAIGLLNIQRFHSTLALISFNKSDIF